MSWSWIGRVLRAPARFWTRETSLTVLLVFLVLTVFVLGPVSASIWPARKLVDFGFALILIAGVFTVFRSGWAAWSIVTLVICGQVFHWLIPLFPSRLAFEIDSVWGLFVVTGLAGVVMLQVFNEGPVTIHRIRGAVVVYLLLGLMWALIYQLIELEIPGAVRLTRPAVSPPGLIDELLYFSFSTLTTIGFGDTVPVHPLARSAAILEGLIGQLFPAVLLGRLVSLHIQHHDKRSDGG